MCQRKPHMVPPKHAFLCVATLICTALLSAATRGATPPRLVSIGPDGKLTYVPDGHANRIPDYSHAGYRGGGASIPDVPVRIIVAPAEGDVTARVQAAIDYVSRLRPDADGFRGAVFLPAGRYPISGSLRVAASGVVLRGAGDATVLVATGTDRRTLIRFNGRNDLVENAPRKIIDPYVPVGSLVIRVASADGMRVGDDVVIRRPSTDAWISQIGMHQFPGRDGGDFRFSWLPGKMDLTWRRTVVAVSDDAITLDSPLTTAIEATLGEGVLSKFTWPGQLRQVGVEGLRCESEFDPANPRDEQHAWMAIGMESVRDAWVREVTAVHFVSSLVNLLETCDRITVQDCRSLEPVSELAGYRRHTFYTNGQRTLFLRCHAEQGRRDFCVGYLSAGPNAFVSCDAVDARDFSGTIESWASGVLFDNMNTDGQIKFDNREIWDQGAGWTAANCMLWNCTAPVITVRNPPGAQNWVFGCWGMFAGDGHWGVVNEFIKPDSLYLQQLTERLGSSAATAIGRRPLPHGAGGAKTVDELASDELAAAAHPATRPTRKVEVRNGWLVSDGNVVAGERVAVNWWKGRIIPSLAGDYGVNITRFVPGRVGPGLTDDLDELTDSMVARGQVLLSHNWGLWYDERRQDHEIVRRIDADAWPPFYEQAWARSGTGTAWDGLSRYDLTRYNAWYFARLKQFADLCDRKGLLLVNQMYFQHNVLEAGAHWVDTPWRPANALQDLGFPEPPQFVDRKRIFMADAFYDLSNPRVREFHRAFIRHSLDNFAQNNNVIQVIGEEFTGPLAFIQFWIDTIAEWERDNGKRPIVGLSCTKDVQDAILADPGRGALVSVIEMKYWWHLAGGKVFEPRGGQDLSPRQQIREFRGKSTRSEVETASQIREYRLRFPDKAIICDYSHLDEWSALVAGASVVPIPNCPLRTAVARMRPANLPGKPAQQWALSDPGSDYLALSLGDGAIPIDLTGAPGRFIVEWIDPASGQTTAADETVGGQIRTFEAPKGSRHLLWLHRKQT